MEFVTCSLEILSQIAHCFVAPNTRTLQLSGGRGYGGSRNLIHWISIFRNSVSFWPILIFSLLFLGYLHPLSQTPFTLRPISSKPPGLCPQVERGTMTVGPQFWFHQFQVAGIILQRCVVFLISNKRSFHLFLLPFSLLQSFLDLVGQPSTFYSF